MGLAVYASTNMHVRKPCVCVECNMKKRQGRPVDTTAKEGYGVILGRPLGTTKEVGYIWC